MYNINTIPSKLVLIAKQASPQAIKSLSGKEKKILKTACDSIRLITHYERNAEVQALTYKLASRDIAVKAPDSKLLRIIRSIFKAIANLFHCRIGTNELIKKVESTIQRYLIRNGDDLYNDYKEILSNLIANFDRTAATQADIDHFKHTLDIIETFYLGSLYNRFGFLLPATCLRDKYTAAVDKNDFFMNAFNIADINYGERYQRLLNYNNGQRAPDVINIVNPVNADDSEVDSSEDIPVPPADGNIENIGDDERNASEKAQLNDVLFVQEQEYFFDLGLLFRERQIRKYAEKNKIDHLNSQNVQLILSKNDFQNNYINAKSFKAFLEEQAVVGKGILVGNEPDIISQEMVEAQVQACINAGLIMENYVAAPVNIAPVAPPVVQDVLLPQPVTDDAAILASWKIYNRMLESLEACNNKSRIHNQAHVKNTITMFYTAGVLYKEEILNKIKTRQYTGCFHEPRSKMYIHLEGGGNKMVNGEWIGIPRNTPAQEYQLAENLLREAPGLLVQLFLHHELEDNLANFFSRAFPHRLCLDERYEALITYANETKFGVLNNLIPIIDPKKKAWANFNEFFNYFNEIQLKKYAKAKGFRIGGNWDKDKESLKDQTFTNDYVNARTLKTFLIDEIKVHEMDTKCSDDFLTKESIEEKIAFLVDDMLLEP
jgi:hypothetical protein